ncbi:hypothetical protein HED60_04875 [Planctomycetales bacterium ZRK34]|nr:hypothetical protein HED60_04875 [Planctomycetales bacterium ZRK34]
MLRRKHLHGRFHRPHRMRFWGAAILVVLASIVAGAYWYISRPHRVAMYAGQLLEAMTGAEAHIDSATFSLDGTIDLRGLTLNVPGMEGRGSELFRAEQTLLRIDPVALLQGKFEAQQMMLFKPVLSLTEIGEDEFNYELLRKVKRVKPQDEMPRLPRIYLREGRVAYGEVYGGEYQSWGLDVTGRLNPDTDQAGLYHFELYQLPDKDDQVLTTTGDPNTAPALTGRFDLEKLEVSVQLVGSGLVNPHRTVMPRQIRQWWDMFEPSGALPQIQFEYDDAAGFHAVVSFSDVALTLPQLSTDEYKARMTNVSGTFRFDNDRISVEELVGQLEGLQYRINGRIEGYKRDAPFQLAVSTRPFRIPEKPVYMVALKPEILRIFQMLSPVGWMRVSLSLNRSTEGGRIDYEGTSTILSGRDLVRELIGPPGSPRPTDLGSLDPSDEAYNSHGHFERFPYELTNCRGLVTFNDQVIEVKHLTGDLPDGASATITGTIGPPSPQAAIDLTVTAVNLALNDELREALPEKTLKGWDMFFNRERFEQIHQRGYFITTAERDQLEQRRQQTLQLLREFEQVDLEQAAEQYRILEDVQKKLTLPVFDLGGRGNAVVKVTRPFGPGKIKFTLHTSVELVDAGVVFQFFPYPVRVRKGRVIIAPREVSFEGFNGFGLHGGYGGMIGKVQTPHESNGNRVIPEIVLSAKEVPLDDMLYDALPEPQDDWLRSLRVAGKINVEGRILRDTEADRIDIDMGVEVTDATAAPGSGRLKLTDLAGQLKLSLHQMTIESMAAACGDGRIAFTGGSDWSDKDRRTMHILASAENLRFEDSVLDLISPAVEAPQALRDFWSTHAPAGRFDAKLEYAVVGQDDRQYRLDLQPRSLAFTFRDFRYDFAQTDGHIIVEPDVVRMDQFSGTFDAGRFDVTGDVRYTPKLSADLSMMIAGETFSPTARAAMPQRVVSIVEGLKLTGPYELSLSKLTYSALDDDRADTYATGTLALNGASMNIGLPVTDFHGTVELETRLEADATWPTVRTKIHADRLLAASRPVEDLTLKLRNVAGSDRVLLTDLAGRCAEGRIGGQGAFTMSTGDYQLQLALSEARLGQLMVYDDASEAPKKPDAKPINGTLSASIALDGSWADRKKLRGRGDLIVRGADLRGVPLAVGLLKISHLKLPVNDPFDTAQVSYYIRGGNFVFENISLTSPTMQLAGRGVMTYPETQLDLALTSSNPKGLKLGPFTDLVDGFRDQLMTIHITGTLDDPNTSVDQFSGLTRAWHDVFGPAAAEVPTPASKP